MARNVSGVWGFRLKLAAGRTSSVLVPGFPVILLAVNSTFQLLGFL